MNMIRLIRLVVFRNIWEEKFLTFLSIIGVALGIALFVGVKVAVDRAILSFESDIRGMNPLTTHEILDIAGIEFREDVYRHVRGIEEKSYPVIRTTGLLPLHQDPIEITGVYTIRAMSLLTSSSGKKYDLESFFTNRNGVFVTEKFADKNDFTKGDIFDVSVYDRHATLKIVDVLDTELIPVNTVIMDIANYQEHFNKFGYISQIDLVADEKTVQKIGAILPANLTVERKEKIITNQKALLRSFRYNLLFVSLIAVLVGVFLLYNTVFVSVIKRRKEIGILRGLGIGKKTVMALFTIQGGILGLGGSMLGVLLGQFFSYFTILAVERTLTNVYSGVSITNFLLTGEDLVKSLILGLSVSLAASLIPSYESTKIKPNESTKEGSLERRYRRYQTLFSIIGFLCISCGAILCYIEYRKPPFDFPFLSYVGILLFILGFTSISPHYLRVVLKIIKGPAHRLFRGTGKIAIGGLDGSLYRFSVALMSVAISSALVFAMLTSIFSLRTSLKHWINRNITADVYIKPSACLSNYCFSPISDDVVQIVKNAPEVESVERFRVLKVDLKGNSVIAGFGNTEILRKYGDVKYFDEDTVDRLMRLEKEREVSISDYLSIQYGLKRGDEISLMTPKGKKTFIVNNSFISYSTTSGFVYLDRKWLKAFWGIDDATQLSVYVKKGQDVKRFVHRLKDRLSGRYALDIRDNRELRNTILSIFDKSFAITYAIEIIAILVSLIGMVNALLVLVLEKKREISVIRYIGGSWKQIRNMIILSSGIIGLAGIILGTIMGPAISLVIIHVINRLSFGWEVDFAVPLIPLSFLMVLLFLTTIIAGFIPSEVASKTDPKAFISFE